jgi:hypothetical protein
MDWDLRKGGDFIFELMAIHVHALRLRPYVKDRRDGDDASTGELATRRGRKGLELTLRAR